MILSKIFNNLTYAFFTERTSSESSQSIQLQQLIHALTCIKDAQEVTVLTDTEVFFYPTIAQANLSKMIQLGATPEALIKILTHKDNKNNNALDLAVLGDISILNTFFTIIKEAGANSDLIVELLIPTPQNKENLLSKAIQHGDVNKIYYILEELAKAKLSAEKFITALNIPLTWQEGKHSEKCNDKHSTLTHISNKGYENLMFILLNFLKKRSPHADLFELLIIDYPEGLNPLIISAKKGDVGTLKIILSIATPEQKLQLLVKHDLLSLLVKNTRNILEIKKYLFSLMDEGVALNNEHMKKAGLNVNIDAHIAYQTKKLKELLVPPAASNKPKKKNCAQAERLLSKPIIHNTFSEATPVNLVSQEYALTIRAF